MSTDLGATQELKPFVSGSINTIQSAYHGKPFVLALWSVDCVHCYEDMDILAAAVAQHPAAEIVMVSVDSPSQQQEVQNILRAHHLTKSPHWIFADHFTERLRYEIDTQWHGELPRTYFYSSDGSRSAISGKLNRQMVHNWFKQALRHD